MRYPYRLSLAPLMAAAVLIAAPDARAQAGGLRTNPVLTASIAAPKNASSSAASALRYLAQAKTLLSKVRVDDNPGDGGAEHGTLTRQRFIDLYVYLADAQKALGDTAGAKASLGRATTLVVVKGQARQMLADDTVELLLKQGFVSEAVALSKKHDIDGFRAPALAKALKHDAPAASAILRDGIVRSAKRKETVERFAILLDIAETAVDPAVRTQAAQAALPLIPTFPEDELEAALQLCHAAYLKIGNDPAQAEQRLRATAAERPGLLALGLIYLDKKAEAMTALARPDSLSRFPRRFLFMIEPDALIAQAKRVEGGNILAEAAFQLGLKGQNPALQYRLLNAAEALDPDEVDMRQYARVAQQGLPSSPIKTAAQQKALKLLRREIADFEKFCKEQPATGEYEKSSRDARWSEIAEIAAPMDTALARKYLARVTEARYRVPVLIALARAGGKQ